MTDPIDELWRLAAEADEETADVEPEEQGEVGDIEDHHGRGIEEDPGE